MRVSCGGVFAIPEMDIVVPTTHPRTSANDGRVLRGAFIFPSEPIDFRRKVTSFYLSRYYNELNLYPIRHIQRKKMFILLLSNITRKIYRDNTPEVLIIGSNYTWKKNRWQSLFYAILYLCTARTKIVRPIIILYNALKLFITNGKKSNEPRFE